jgi:hypothetical protein
LLSYLRTLRPGQWKQVAAAIETILPLTNVRGYRAIAEEAARLGWATQHRTDLTEIDLGILCVPGAPRSFWWGIRPSGTDLFRPNDLVSVSWAQAQPPTSTERRYYAYTGEALKAVSLERMVAQLVRSLDPGSFEQALRDAVDAVEAAGQVRPRSREAAAAHQEAQRAERRAREQLAEVRKLKQRYA